MTLLDAPPSVLPVNLDAERCILGAVLLDAGAYDEAVALGIVSTHFSLDSHRKIFSVFEELSYNGSNFDLITLAERLDQRKQLQPVGDVAYLSSLIDGLPERPSIRSYIKIVLEKAAQRRMITACNTTMTGIVSGEMSSSEAVEAMQNTILYVQAGTDQAPAEPTSKFSVQAYDEWWALANSDKEIIGLTTGIRCLDMATTGIRAKELWVMGARTGDGKTNFALQVAGANCENGTPVGFLSLEMDRNALLQRLWSQAGCIPANNIRYPRNLEDYILRQTKSAMFKVAEWPLFVAEESSLTLNKLLAKAQLMIRRNKIELLIIDYIQKIVAPGMDMIGRMTQVSEGLRRLAKDTGVPVLALSQFSRPAKGNPNIRPNKFDFKESGSIENDAHVALLGFRPEDEFGQKTGDDEIIVAKQRNGQFSIERVRLQPWLKFDER